MQDVTVVYWRDIPAQIIVGAGRKAAKRQLPERFEQAIDRAAMRSRNSGTDDYLAEWRKEKAAPEEGEAEEIAARLAARFDAEYSPERLRELIANDGRA